MSNDPTGSFKTHANYIRALAYLVDPAARDQDPSFVDISVRTRESGILAAAPNAMNVDTEQVKRSLNNAWGTELLLSLGTSVIREDELVALSNNWSVVQSYYATYHAVQALAASKRFARPDSHPKTQNQYYNLWVQRPVQLAPWTMGAGHDAYLNLPPGAVVDEQIHPWTGCDRDSSWGIACKALRTTREDAVSEAFARKRDAKRRARRQEWFREQRERQEAGRRPRRGNPPDTRPTLTSAEKAEIRKAVRPATILDYLFRLRIKTNYVDANMFTDGPESANDSWQVRRDISTVTAGTLLVHELAVGSALGFGTLATWASDWTRRNLPAGSPYGLAARLPMIEAFRDGV